MREDMKKLLCERPRLGGSYRNGTKKRIRKDVDEERDQKFSGMKQRTKHYTGLKELNEYLNPLKRWLLSQVGRPWDKVFSEIVKACPNDSAVNAHIYQHLYGYVTLDCYSEGGIVYCSDGRTLASSRYSDLRLYVESSDGILKKLNRTNNTVRQWKHLYNSVPDIRWLTEDSFVHQSNGIWFQYFVKPFENDFELPLTDVFMAAAYPSHQERMDLLTFYRSSSSTYRKLYKKAVYCYKRQQLSSREIKKLKLNEEKAKNG